MKHFVKKHHRYLFLVTLVTTFFCMLYLVFAAVRGWVTLDFLTSVVTLVNCALLLVLLQRDGVERDA